MAKRYRVTLTSKERIELEAMIGKGKADARKRAHARILLQADEVASAPARTDHEVASTLNACARTVERVRPRFVEAGLQAALLPKPTQRISTRTLDGAHEAYLIALACSPPPAGKKRWTLRLLAERMVEPSDAEAVSQETVRRVRKTTS